MFRKILAFTCSMMLLVSCGKGVIFDEMQTIPGDNFQRFTEQKFEVDIDNIDDCYDLYVTTTIDTSCYVSNSLPIMVTVDGPNGDSRMFRNIVSVRDKDGNWKGDIDGSTLTTVTRVREYYFFNVAGMHTVRISQCSHKYDIRGISKVGFRVVKADLVYPD